MPVGSLPLIPFLRTCLGKAILLPTTLDSFLLRRNVLLISSNFNLKLISRSITYEHPVPDTFTLTDTALSTSFDENVVFFLEFCQIETASILRAYLWTTT